MAVSRELPYCSQTRKGRAAKPIRRKPLERLSVRRDVDSGYQRPRDHGDDARDRQQAAECGGEPRPVPQNGRPMHGDLAQAEPAQRAEQRHPGGDGDQAAAPLRPEPARREEQDGKPGEERVDLRPARYDDVLPEPLAGRAQSSSISMVSNATPTAPSDSLYCSSPLLTFCPPSCIEEPKLYH